MIPDQINFKSFLGMLCYIIGLHRTLPKKKKMNAQATGDDLDVEIVSKMEIIYEDTKSITGVEP